MNERITTIALACLPYAGLGAFITFCRIRKSIEWNDQIEMTPIMRKALTVHFWYFIAVPVMIEAFATDIPGLDFLVGSLPPPTTNGFHMIQCLAAENFFVTSVALGFLLTQQVVPRWTLMTPFAQIAWNLKNHLSWYFIPLAPEGRMPFAVVDMFLIWPITAVYIHNFFNAKRDIEKKD